MHAHCMTKFNLLLEVWVILPPSAVFQISLVYCDLEGRKVP